MAYLMGIDIGTTGAKTLLINEEGKVIATNTQEYPLHTPRPNWAEQDPNDWWEGTINSIKNVLSEVGVGGEEIKGVGLSGQMHGSVFLDRNHNVLRPCILWCDQRTAKQCNYITEKIGRERLIQLTCNPALTGFTAGKILWVRENEPQVYERTHKILLPKDYIRFKLTGEFATEVSDASGTLLFDVRKRRWSDEMLEELDIDRDFMPKCFESPVVSGKITDEVARITGLKSGTPVVGGGGDNAAAAVGSGIVRAGRVFSSLGTSGVVFAHSNQVEVDPSLRVHTFCHAVPGTWHVMGVMLAAGGSFRWFRDNLGTEEVEQAREEGVDPYEILTRKAAEAKPGCDGLIFLPYLSGERTPHANPNAKGVFFGLSLSHRKAHLIRAVLEGVTFGMRDSLEIIKGMGIPVEEVRALGGGARSSLWRQMQADIMNEDILTINVAEGAGYGAAVLAGVGTKMYENVQEACDNLISTTSRTKPNKENVQLYEDYYRVFQQLYPPLVESFDKVNDLVDKYSEKNG